MIPPKFVAMLIVVLISFLAFADAHAYYFIIIPILALDAGLTLANANALSKDDPNMITGIAGLTMGLMITYTGALALAQVEELWQFGASVLLGSLGVASVVYGWRAIRSSRQKDVVAQDGHNVRLIPILSPGDRSDLQIGLVVEVSY